MKKLLPRLMKKKQFMPLPTRCTADSARILHEHGPWRDSHGLFALPQAKKKPSPWLPPGIDRFVCRVIVLFSPATPPAQLQLPDARGSLAPASAAAAIAGRAQLAGAASAAAAVAGRALLAAAASATDAVALTRGSSAARPPRLSAAARRRAQLIGQVWTCGAMLWWVSAI
jgi:hypothetical protein